MRALYVVEQGAVLRRSGELLVVERDGETLARVPLLRLQLVLLFGNVHVTTPTLAVLLERGIELVLLTADGEYRGRLVGPESGSAELRIRQLEAARDEALALDLARRFVRGKLRNQGVLLMQYRDRHPDIPRAIDAIRDALQRAARAGGHGGLLAAEGYGSGAYFSALATLFPSTFPFPGRQRRPPPDPVNALLSLGYTLLTQRAVSALRAVGLDPQVGFLHQLRPGRPSLALDLIEEFRPVIDALVLELLTRDQLQPEHFAPPHPERGVRLTPDGLRLFLASWEAWWEQPLALAGTRRPARDALFEQARRLARVLRAPAEPYLTVPIEAWWQAGEPASPVAPGEPS
ncbi:MAG: CRISPR-associated endonuclease Cas1 [Thermomicrobium sp.]|nr:CRISPR-associated endonuclease Cas1 [Thermomicrobium sp.]